MIRRFACLSSVAILVQSICSWGQSVRVPAVPLITHDPYFSVWSMNETLTDGVTKHWTGTRQPLTGLIRIDGQTFRWMGDRPRAVPPAKQTNLEITPTRTVYRFEQQGVRLDVSFLSPLLPFDLDVLSRPVSYVTITNSAIDGAKHKVQILFEASSLLAVDRHTQETVWTRSRLPGMTVLTTGNFEQRVLANSGDDVRIDWGYALVAIPDQSGATTATQIPDAVESAFAAGTPLSGDDLDLPRRADRAAVLAAAFDLDSVGVATVSRHILLGYDDLYSIEYMNRWLRPYWRRKGMGIGELLGAAERDYTRLHQQSRQFDDEL